MNIKFLSILLIVVGISSYSFAGPPPPPHSGATGGHPGCWPPPCIPVDGGISLLIAAGAIYGGRKLYSNRKEKNSL